MVHRGFGGFSGYAAPVAKVSAYTLTPMDHGKLFTTRGATAAVTFTLPTAADLPAGWGVSFAAVGDVAMTISSPEGDNIVGFNNATADSVAFGTASEIIGGAVTFIWDGTGWLVFEGGAGGHLQTVTYADS